MLIKRTVVTSVAHCCFPLACFGILFLLAGCSTQFQSSGVQDQFGPTGAETSSVVAQPTESYPAAQPPAQGFWATQFSRQAGATDQTAQVTSTDKIATTRVMTVKGRNLLSLHEEERTFRSLRGETGGYGIQAHVPGEFVNSLGMSFNLLPPGQFFMGEDESRKGNTYLEEREYPVMHTEGIHMQTTEVTQGQWRMVMGDNPSHFQNCGDDCPVEMVSWRDTQVFISRLNEMLQDEDPEFMYRLPTENEWEYAGRAGNPGDWYNSPLLFGGGANEYQLLDQIAWYYNNSGQGTHRVAQKEPNKFGLYDMHGNVWEWVQEWNAPYPYSDKQDSNAPEIGFSKILRGGSWSEMPFFSRVSTRIYRRDQKVDSDMGFRLVRVPRPQVVEPYMPPEEPIYEPLPRVAMEGRTDPPMIPIYFDLDSSMIRGDQAQRMEHNVDFLQNTYSGRIRIEGNCDPRATNEYNIALGERRALSAQKYLLQSGIRPERLQTISYGEERLLPVGDDEYTYALNRRVDFIILEKE